MNEVVVPMDYGLIDLKLIQNKELVIPKPFEKDILLFSTFIAGTTHIDGMLEMEKNLSVGDMLDFFREPDNVYDPGAIVIKNKYENKIGYVPKKDNIIFSRLMDAGKILFGKIKSKEVRNKYVRIEMDIFLHE